MRRGPDSSCFAVRTLLHSNDILPHCHPCPESLRLATNSTYPAADCSCRHSLQCGSETKMSSKGSSGQSCPTYSARLAEKVRELQVFVKCHQLAAQRPTRTGELWCGISSCIALSTPVLHFVQSCTMSSLRALHIGVNMVQVPKLMTPQAWEHLDSVQVEIATKFFA